MKKLSPLERLERDVENLAYAVGIDHEAHPEKHDAMWVVGYYQALQKVLDKIEAIRRGKL